MPNAWLSSEKRKRKQEEEEREQQKRIRELKKRREIEKERKLKLKFAQNEEKSQKEAEKEEAKKKRADEKARHGTLKTRSNHTAGSSKESVAQSGSSQTLRSRCDDSSRKSPLLCLISAVCASKLLMKIWNRCWNKLGVVYLHS